MGPTIYFLLDYIGVAGPHCHPHHQKLTELDIVKKKSVKENKLKVWTALVHFFS